MTVNGGITENLELTVQKSMPLRYFGQSIVKGVFVFSLRNKYWVAVNYSITLEPISSKGHYNRSIAPI